MKPQTRQILQISDLHLTADTTPVHPGVADSWTQLQRILAHIRLHCPDAGLLLATGDLLQRPDTAVYARLAHHLAQDRLPVCAIAGNHDSRELARSQFANLGLGFEGSCTLGNWIVIALNSAQDGQTSGWIDEAEFDRLEATAERFAGYWIAVAVHHPPVPLGSAWLDRIGLGNGDRLLAWLDARPQARLCLFGHAHQDFEGARGHLHILGCPATCIQFEPGSREFALARTASGYRRIDLGDDGSVRSQVVRVPGTEPDEALTES